jgi:magnesium transporter
MAKFIKKSPKKAGQPPGTLMHVGEKKVDQPRITVIDYDESNLNEREVHSVEECFPFLKSSTTTWINIDGIHDVALIEKIGQQFGIHPLALEDILNTGHPPKMEDFDDFLLIIMKMLSYEEDKHEISSEQVSMLVGNNYVITFQEKIGDVFDPIRVRIRGGRPRLRGGGTDYLAYALIDVIVDNYFTVLEKVGDEIEDVEDELESDPDITTLHRIRGLKRETLFLRKSVWPLREMINGLEKLESELVKDSIVAYLRDVYDHTIQIIDTIETFRDILSGLLDVYMSAVSNRMNEVMKVLTIIATIFIPLTFLAGIYGMNFHYMPELSWKLGYPAVLVVMAAVAVFMLFFFKRKKWL